MYLINKRNPLINLFIKFSNLPFKIIQKTCLTHLIIFFLFLLSFERGFAQDMYPLGGVSGGGGNVIDPTPPDNLPQNSVVKALVRNSFFYMKTYLQIQESKYLNGERNSTERALFSLIFSGSESILNAINRVRPKVEDDEPCFDFEGQPVDASIASKERDTFCVSSYSIGNKVIQNEIPIQSTALLVHEYSEIIGLNEDAAVNLQKQVLKDLKSNEFSF